MKKTKYFHIQPHIRIAYQLHSNPDTDRDTVPLVCIQGMSGVKEDWYGFDLLLARHRTVLVFDNRGIGESSLSHVNKNENDIKKQSENKEELYFEPISIITMATDTIQLIRFVFPNQKVHLFGLSMGGVIAQQVCILAPQLIHSLILGCTWWGGSHGVFPDFSSSLMELRGIPKTELREKLKDVMVFNYTKKWIEQNKLKYERLIDESLRYKRPANIIMGQMLGMGGVNLKEELKSIKLDGGVLILHGTHDHIISYENALLIAATIPHSIVYGFKYKGHLFFLMDGGGEDDTGRNHEVSPAIGTNERTKETGNRDTAVEDMSVLEVMNAFLSGKMQNHPQRVEEINRRSFAYASIASPPFQRTSKL